jgi:uncharacterized protein
MQEEPISSKPQVSYPCEWEFKVIGTDESALRRAIGRIVGDRAYHLDVSNRSTGGKYASLRLAVRVDNEADRNAIFNTLREHKDVTTLL